MVFVRISALGGTEFGRNGSWFDSSLRRLMWEWGQVKA
jgi:hypothetical protein